MAGQVVANILHNGHLRHAPKLENIPYSLDATPLFVKRKPSGPASFPAGLDKNPGETSQ